MLRHQTVQQIESRSGPLPDASELEHYERILPGLADRIMKMAESEVAARHEANAKALDAQIRDNDRARTEKRIGQFLAFFLASAALVMSLVAALKGAELFGGALAAMSIGAICLAFLVGGKQAKSN